MQQIYIIVSKTPTVLAKCIRLLTRTEYSHASISLDDSANNMLSFGRKFHWYPFLGGLVDEGKSIGFFKHFKNSKITIFEMKIENDKYDKLVSLINEFKSTREKYKFNILGMFFSGMKIPYGKSNKYFCSQFVAHLLQQSNIYDFKKDVRLVRPYELAKLPNTKIIYNDKISKHI